MTWRHVKNCGFCYLQTDNYN